MTQQFQPVQQTRSILREESRSIVKSDSKMVAQRVAMLAEMMVVMALVSVGTTGVATGRESVLGHCFRRSENLTKEHISWILRSSSYLFTVRSY